MRGLGLAATLVLASATAIACGSSFSSGPSGDGGEDAGPGGFEAGSDAPGGDGPSGSSSGASSSGGTTEAGTSWCAQFGSAYKFCEDFDETTQVQSFLSSYWPTYSQSGASFGFDTSAKDPSPPNALTITTTKTSAVDALAIHPIPKTGTSSLVSQKLEFDLRIDAASNVGIASAAAFAAILFGTDINHGAVSLALGSGSPATMAVVYLEPSDGGSPGFGSANSTQPFPTTGVWAGRFSLVITFATSTTTGCAQLYVGGQPQLSPCLALPPSLAHPGTDTAIALGVYGGGLGNTGNVSLEFDDVIYDSQ